MPVDRIMEGILDGNMEAAEKDCLVRVSDVKPLAAIAVLDRRSKPRKLRQDGQISANLSRLRLANLRLELHIIIIIHQDFGAAAVTPTQTMCFLLAGVENVDRVCGSKGRHYHWRFGRKLRLSENSFGSLIAEPITRHVSASGLEREIKQSRMDLRSP
ncbi:hypothetical protein M8818_002139 [Zalaria obscura]|uniref:Uncharacterized protein n=1 Tax=Zalaria obscura TaxID=2024903 RepID=A0ACC3SIJ3_9PEZI